MQWEVEATDELVTWSLTLTSNELEALTDRIDLLAEREPDLGCPVVDRIHQSRHHNMKELRAAKDGAIRPLLVFDPWRRAIRLLGGDKRGSGRPGTSWAVPMADGLYDTYLAELREEGLL